jgi:hypothetical protein
MGDNCVSVHHGGYSPGYLPGATPADARLV